MTGTSGPRILLYLEDKRFLQAFRRKGRFTDLLVRVPVHVILNPRVALLGAARHGFEMQSKTENSSFQGKDEKAGGT